MATEEITSASAAVTLRASQGDGRIVRPFPGAFQFYQSTSYPSWVNDVRNWISLYGQRRAEALSVLGLELVLENSGTVPADGLIFEYSVAHEACFLPLDDEEVPTKLETPAFPRPPAVPQPTFKPNFDFPSMTPIIPNFDFQRGRANRDPYAFYWQDKPETAVDRHVFECEEFRHGSVERFSASLLLPSTPDPGSMAIVLRATARNLPTPWEFQIPIRYVVASQDPLDELRSLIAPPKSKVTNPVTFRLSTSGRGVDPDTLK